VNSCSIICIPGVTVSARRRWFVSLDWIPYSKKVHSRSCHEGPEGEKRYSST